jgi:hypothetical protein
MDCKIKNFVLKEGGRNAHIQYIPDSVVISEGSFRIRLEKMKGNYRLVLSQW